MKAFEMLSVETQYIMVDILFLAAMIQLALCICRYFRRGKQGMKIIDALVLFLIFCACAYILAAEYEKYPESFPWLLCPVIAFFVFIYAILGIKTEYCESFELLSPYSVKQTLDNLNSGILFADAGGRVVLVNYRMNEIIAEISGSYPQMLDDLTDALEKIDEVNGSSKLYRFPDGQIWRFQTVPLSEPELAGFTQTTAQNMTELYDTNRKLAEENISLKVAIEKTRRMLACVADRVREQETLEIKVQLHNDIGKSLIALSELMKGGVGEPDEQLHILHKAVSLFEEGGMTLPGTMEDVRREAEEIRVELVLDGIIPQNEQMEHLITAAARECVTNCVRHANGNHVIVKIIEHEDLYTVTITNDGKVPTEPIVEGGGLSSLRHSVEEAGGEMYISHSPYFALILNLTGRRQEL